MRRSFPFLIAAILLSCRPSAAQPARVILEGIEASGFVKASVSADGGVVALNEMRSGFTTIFRTSTAQVWRLNPVLEPMDVTGKYTSEGAWVNPDGRFLINATRQMVAVRNIESGRELWRGELAGLRSAYATLAVHYDAGGRRLRFVDNNSVYVYELADNGTARAHQPVSVSFSDSPDAKAWSNFVRSAAFNVDGQVLYVGNMAGEVLKVSLSGDSPKLLARAKVFDALRSSTTDKVEPTTAHVSSVSCAEGCRFVVVSDHSKYQAAILDGADLQLLGRAVKDQPYHLVHIVGVGASAFSVDSGSRVVTPTTTVQIMGPDLKPLGTLEQPGWTQVAGYAGGAVVVARSQKGHYSYLAWSPSALQSAQARTQWIEDERKRADAADKAQREHAAQADIAEKRNEDEQRKKLVAFRQKLASGDDSHCGLVIQRKGDIAQVETMIGPKWLKVSQLAPPGTRRCTFLNGVYQE